MTAVLPARRPGAATELPPETDTQDEVLGENFHPTTRHHTHGRGGLNMTSIRRVAILIGLTLAVIIGAGIPASASFAESVTVSTAIATGTVAAPAGITVNDYCVTTTTTVQQTVRRDPITGISTTTAYSSTTTSATSATNVQSYSSTPVAGPGLDETTTTTVSKNTDLYVTVSWPASGSRGVSGYVVSAHLADGSIAPMLQTGATTTSTSAVVDADNLWYGPALSITTLTSYGWTAQSVRSALLAC
jgi:hypothetical protein